MDTQLGRAVALKLAWPGILIDSASSRRFAQEPKTVALLSHPGIVEVFESGNFELAWYIALELIEGPGLAQWIKSQDHVPERIAVGIVDDVAQAIGYAHARRRASRFEAK